MTTNNPLDVITYKPYRGQCEPVTNITIAKIVLFKEYIEIRCFYDFKEFVSNDDPKRYRDNFVKCHLIMKRESLEVCHTVRVNPLDEREEELPLIEIYGKSGLRFNMVAGSEDCVRAMKALRDWILS